MILTGQGSKLDLSINEKEQCKVISGFKSGEYNLLISTDIAQEGLDIPECNYVIRYEFVSNEIGTVQSRGRARAEKGQCFLVTSFNSINYHREQKNRKFEDEMQLTLKYFHSIDPSEIDQEYEKIIEQRNKKQEDEIIGSQYLRSIEPKYSSKEVTVHCRHCSQALFNGSQLKYREPSYYSTCDNFAKNLVAFDEQKVKILCAQKECNKELGRLVPIRKGESLRMIDIKGIKFSIQGQFKIFKQWSKILELFHVENL